MRQLLLAIGLLAALSSCVPNRKFLYLQKDDVKKKDMPRDTIVRSYQTQKYEYRIQPHDILSIRFESLTSEEFDFLNRKSNEAMLANPQAAIMMGELVNDEGYIVYPVLGKVQVSGLTLFEIQSRLQELANLYLESPKVIVRLVNFRVTILGEVNKEGQVNITNNRANIMEAIGLLGGFGDLADKSKVKVMRQNPSGQVDVVYVDLLKEEVIESPYYYVHQGDIIVVPPLNQRPFRKYFGPNLALIVSSLSLALLAANLLK